MRTVRGWRPLWVAVAIVVGGLAASTVGLAAPAQIREHRAEAERVLAEIQAIDVELELAIEAWNGANERLDGLEETIRENRRHLALARATLADARARLADRLVTLYVSGEEDVVEVIFGSASLDDIIDRLDAAKRVSAQDAEILAEIRQVKQELIERQKRLERAVAEQKRVVAERAARREAIEAKLAERERLYNSIKEEIQQLEAEERERQRRLREEAEKRLEQERLQASVVASPAASPGPEPVGSAPSNRYGSAVVEIAMQYLGIPYVWGGASPSVGFDCSGLIMYVYAQVGVSLPHYAASQYTYGVPVSKDDLEPGDLVFFNNLGHNGMYIGNGQFIHAPHTGDVVKISSLSDPWYTANWVGARRIL